MKGGNGVRVEIVQMAEVDYTVAEISALKNIPQRILRYWLKNGLPSRVRGGVTFIKASDLDDFIKQHVEITTAYRLKKREEDLEPGDE